MIASVDHVLVGVEVLPEAPTLSAVCSCGWRSTVARRPDQAEARWRIHRGERKAASSFATAGEMQRANRELKATLTAQRIATRARREAIGRQRQRLRAVPDHDAPSEPEVDGSSRV